MSAYFVLTIDTECDKRPDWSTRYPFEFRNIYEGIPQRLQPLLQKYGIVPTYLLSPEIIADTGCRQAFASHPGLFELGTHLHGEYIGPEADLAAKGTFAFQADYAPSVEAAKLENLTRQFSEAFGAWPTAFRAGRFGMGPETLRVLDRLAYRVDSSVFPLHRVRMRSRTNDFYGTPTAAYFPDLDDYEKENPAAKLLELPMTMYSPWYSRIPRRMRKPLAQTPFVERILAGVYGRKFVKTHSLRPDLRSPGRPQFVTENALAGTSDPVFLTMMFHSNELIEGASPYAQTATDVQQFLGELDQYFGFLNTVGIRSIRMTDAWYIVKGLPQPGSTSYAKG